MLLNTSIRIMFDYKKPNIVSDIVVGEMYVTSNIKNNPGKLKAKSTYSCFISLSDAVDLEHRMGNLRPHQQQRNGVG